MQHTITGTPFNVLNLQLDSHDRIVVEAGKTAWMEPSVHMQTSAMQHDGLWGAVKRSLGGGPWFWTSLQGPGRVAIAATLPGSIEHIDMQGGRGVLAHRSAFLAGTAEITVSVGFQQRWTAGLFGGDGFTPQHLRGTGSAWVQLGGSLTTCTLDVGESLYILPQHVALFDDSMAFQITRLNHSPRLKPGGSVGEIRHVRGLSRALAGLLSRRDSLRLRGGYTIPGLSCRIAHDTDRGANFFGRPALT